MRRGAARLAALALLAPLAASAGTWTWDTALATGYDSNAGNGGERHDVRETAAAEVDAGATFEERFGRYTAVQVRGSAAAAQVSEVEDLSSVGGAARVAVLHKPGKGFYVPILAGWASVGARDYGSRIRDSHEFRAGLEATEYVTTAVRARAEVTWSQREAQGRAFDLERMSYGAGLDWVAAPWLTVYGGMRYDDGTFVTSAKGHGDVTPKTEHLYLEPRAEVIEADRAFGGDWWAFRVAGRSWLTTGGVNIPLSGMLALDVQAQYGASQMGKFTYERWLGSVALLARW